MAMPTSTEKEQPRQEAIHSISLKIGPATIAPSLYQGDRLDVGNAIVGEGARGKVGGHSRQRVQVVGKRMMGLIEHWIGRVVRLCCRRDKLDVASVTSGEGGRGCLQGIMGAIGRR